METWNASAGDGSGYNGKSEKRRSETVSVRLDPKLRYIAELAARKQRRTLSSFIEWAIEDSLGRFHIAEKYDQRGNYDPISFNDEASVLWDVEEADRFVKLAFRYPDLLTHHEQIVWKLIRENGYLWRGHYKPEWTWTVSEDDLIFPRLRNCWVAFNKVARGEAPRTVLPTWLKKETEEEPPPADEPPPVDDEDIPF